MRRLASAPGCGLAKVANTTLAMLCLPLVGCVTEFEALPSPSVAEVQALPEARPIAVLTPGTGTVDGVRQQFYAGILRRLEQASKERDPATVDALLESYGALSVSPSMRACMESYRAVSRGLWFQRKAAERASLAVVPSADDRGTPAGEAAAAAGVPPLGEPVELLFQLPAGSQKAVLGGKDAADPVGFGVIVAVEDRFVDGSERRCETLGRVMVERDLELVGDVVLRLPVQVDLPQNFAVQRRVEVRIEWLPCHLLVDGLRVPVRHGEIARTVFLQWPAGHTAVRANPLATLRTALQHGSPDHYPHIALASRFLPVADRAEAIELLIEWIRMGTEAQVRIGTAALRQIVGRGPAIGDRERWLLWWQGAR